MKGKPAPILKLFAVLAAAVLAAAVWNSRACALDSDAEALIKQASSARPVRYANAVKSGAHVLPTSDARSFFVAWRPAGATQPEERRTLVTLHGTEGWVFDEFQLWKKAAEKRRFAVLAIQWWLGKDTSPRGYLTPQEIYAQVRKRFVRENASQGSAVLHGFSRGASNVYAIAAMDRHSGHPYFGLIIANAGGASRDYPPTREIDSGKYGPRPFEGTRWALFCGGKDTNPQRDGCPAMERTGKWIQEKGGKVVLFIRDAGAGHDGFHKSRVHPVAALDAFVPPPPAPLAAQPAVSAESES